MNPEINSSAIRAEITEYVTQNILPMYHTFDRAHDIDHAAKVIANSFALAREFDVDLEMVYVIAAYHDTGLSNGRADHEKHSAAFLRDDHKLAQWFSAEQILAMAEAVEDHRASGDREPRGIYGRIVAEADRDIEYHTILMRVIHYSIENFPDYTPEQHYKRSYGHMKEKYGDGGYLKLCLDAGPNQKNLRDMRAILNDEPRFSEDFKRAFELAADDGTERFHVR